MGSALATLGNTYFGSCCAVRSFLRLGSSLALQSCGRFGATLAILDFLHIGSAHTLAAPLAIEKRVKGLIQIFAESLAE